MKKIAIEIKWGLIYIAIILLWMEFEKLMGWHDMKIDKHPLFTSLFAVPAILLYLNALLDKRNNYYGGNITWFQAFRCGIIISLVVVVFSPLTQLVIHTVITPEYMGNAIEHAVKSEKMTRMLAERYYTLGNYILQSFITIHMDQTQPV